MNNRQTNTNTLTKMRTIDLTLLPLFSALIAVGAFIKVPIGIVPVSAQFVFCALADPPGSQKGFMAGTVSPHRPFRHPRVHRRRRTSMCFINLWLSLSGCCLARR